MERSFPAEVPVEEMRLPPIPRENGSAIGKVGKARERSDK